jgi:hypothetical protein
VAAVSLKKNSVGSTQIKNSSLTGSDVKNSSLTTSDVKNRSLLAKDFKAGQLPAGTRGATGSVGPAGPQGAAGATKVTIRTGTFTAGASTTGSVAAGADCLPGERAVGGGGELSASYSDDTFVANEPLPSAQGATPTGWYVNYYSPTGHPSRTITTYAVCASP